MRDMNRSKKRTQNVWSNKPENLGCQIWQKPHAIVPLEEQLRSKG